MIHISGRIHGLKRETGFEEKNSPLIVNSCGYQKFLTRDYSIHRPGGRVDYQIIYIAQGSGVFITEGKRRRAAEGSILVYTPGEPQIYEYYAKDTPVIYWIHFTGYMSEQVLQKFHISSGYAGTDGQIQEIFREMILELQLKKKYYEDVTLALFYKLMCLFGRAGDEEHSLPGGSRLFEKLIIRLNQEYGAPWNIRKMAECCNMSEGYFSHLFKENMKIAPMQYLTKLRMKKAKELLVGSSMHISEVAEVTGFDDPMYFSRIFKKYSGISPKKYQKNGLFIP